jgi:uncharacterized protein (TIGR00299 family) protein
MKRVLYLECFSGAAGDMLLGALLDAGLPEAGLREAIGSLGVDHDLRISKVVRAGVTATKLDVVPRTGRSGAAESGDGRHHSDTHGHHHHHGHGHHHDHAHDHDHDSAGGENAGAHRTLAEIRALIDRARLSTSVRQRAVALLTRLAEAEAAIHNVPIDEVHLHEVGAVDSIIDIVGCVWGLDWFKADVVASPLNVGSGQVRIAHGTFPVPAPATLRLLAGVPIYAEGPAVELTTPTGALLVAGYAGAFGTMPPMTVECIGYGAGTKDFSDRPNVLRVVVGTAATRPVMAVSANAEVVKIECEIDDMSPQIFGPVMDQLFAAGALDVFLTPVQMKKQRPGTLVTVISPVDRRERLSAILFRETTTIGVRYEHMRRETLDRRIETVETNVGSVRIKVASRDADVLSATPEFDDCLRLAKAAKVPLKSVQAEAMRAWLDRASGTRGAKRRGKRRARKV